MKSEVLIMKLVSIIHLPGVYKSLQIIQQDNNWAQKQKYSISYLNQNSLNLEDLSKEIN